MKQFKLLSDNKDCPASIPWTVIAPFEKQAINNHSQNLETLDRRGGLDPRELYCVMNGMSTSAVRTMNEDFCIRWIKQKCKE